MGEVYRAHDGRLGRWVAVKVLTPDYCKDEEFRERVRREARALSMPSHPNVCAIYDVGTEGTWDFFVMELLDGETLAARLQRGRIAVDETLQIVRQIAAALAAAHRVGVVHRDLKPANIMLTTSHLRITDERDQGFAPGVGQGVLMLFRMVVGHTSSRSKSTWHRLG
jgi:serine/threonine protein kinase